MYYVIKDVGYYKSILHIPKQFLNNGTYVLSLTVFEENYTNPKDFRDILSFYVEDAPSVRGDYFGGLLGCTRPLFEWRTMKIDEGL